MSDSKRGAPAHLLAGPPPGTWRPAHRLARVALAPVERFLRVEAASGIVLLVAAALALGWANSPFRDTYAALWHTPIGLRIGPFAFERDLHFVINEGVMTIFFFVVGLEIRREMHHGELSEARRAALPIAAALGGMLAPALLYFAFNRGLASARGWGVPMATDIAFAVGVLALLGKRVPPALRILLLALAIIDDIGAIVVIAIFYSSGLNPDGLAVLGLGVLGIVALQKVGVRHSWAYIAPAVVVWVGAYVLGVHPTLAGVIVGLLTPVNAWLGSAGFVEHASERVGALREEEDALDSRSLLPHLDALNVARREAVAPVERMEHALHGWVAFGIMPLFALANAGVTFGAAPLTSDGSHALLGIVIGLVVGKPIGIVGLSWICVALGLAALPRGVGWRQIVLVGVIGGIGFTMSLFIAQLAFIDDSLLGVAKLGILLASGLAALLALVGGRFVLAGTSPEGARTPAQAEGSTAL